MIYLDNMLLWENDFTPVRIPKISIDPEISKIMMTIGSFAVSIEYI